MFAPDKTWKLAELKGKPVNLDHDGVVTVVIANHDDVIPGYSLEAVLGL